MALGAAYEDDAIQALVNSPVVAKPAAASKYSVWRDLPEDIGRSATGLAMGSARALTEIAATGADIVGSLRATGIATPEERRKMQRTGAPISSYSSELGDYLRSAGGIFKPDPVTASAAEQVLYGLGRGATKIVGGALAAGPVGVLAAGAEEAVTQADELRLQGVDYNIRTKAGAVQGAGLAIAALPVIGQTAMGTAGLYAIGGPGGFVAQQALTREILQGAGYDKIGEQFDPFDPVSLAVATLLPAGFAAYGLRQQKLQRAAASLPDDPIVTETIGASTITARRSEVEALRRRQAARDGVVDVQATEAQPAPFPSRQTAVVDAVRAYPTEAVDAARVVLLSERRAAANPGAADDLRAMDQHEAALTRAEDQLAAGEAVQVADVAPPARVPVIETPEFQAFFNESRTVTPEGAPMVLYHATSADFPGFADNPRGIFFAERPTEAEPFSRIREGSPVMLPVYVAIKNPWTLISYGDDVPYSKMVDQSVEALKAKGHDGMHDPERGVWVAFAPEQIKSAIGNSGRFDPTTGSLTDSPYATWADQITAAIREMQARTDAPTTPQAANPQAAAPARGAGEPPAAAGAAGAGRPAGVEAAGLTARDTTPAVDGPTAAARQIVEAIQQARQDDPYATYALRVLPDSQEGAKPGDFLPESYVWDDGNQTDDLLDGPSAIRISGDDEASVLASLQDLGATGRPPHETPNGIYQGRRIALIRGENAGSGVDVGEVVVRDAEVVALWDRSTNQWAPIKPNDQPAPVSGGATDAAGLTGPAGTSTEAITERGLTVPLRYRLTEAGDLTTSHTNDLTPNPAFPAELQPRDRARAASAEQISRIENAIRPELLGESVKASDGAPIVGPDAVVESGNARTIALRRAYEIGKADAYRAWLADNAERFGLTRQQVEGMRQPVLVRERLGNVDRAEFARQANESAVAAMSPTEQAMSDARRITDLTGLVANEDGTINMAQSADFVRQFIQHAVAPTERGAMLQANGQLSQAGMNRLRNAVFAKAYGDTDILAMLTESTDANVRNILAGMLRAAPEVAKLADLAQTGARQDADIAGPLVEAVRLFSQLRSEGRTVQQFMAQGSMFGDGLSPEIAAMLEAVSLNARAPKRIAEMIGGMVDGVNALGDSRQMGMFGDAPTGADAVAGAAERAVMDSRMAMAAEKFPALEVMVDGMEKPMPMTEFLAAAKAEADDLAADAPLMQIAAECALLNGAG